MAQFDDDDNLTSLGRSAKRRLRKICDNARGNAGQLTALGSRQHRGIARRMIANYPEPFTESLPLGEVGGELYLQARSSTVPRCRASMLAFCDELKRRQRHLSIQPETDASFMAYINYDSPELKALIQRTSNPSPLTPHPSTVSTSRFVGSLFKDPSRISQPYKLMSELHTIASDMQDIPLNVSLWDLFTYEEMLAVHDANNERMTICNGDTLVNDGIPARSSIPLWNDIKQQADSIIQAGAHGATLRFGHDTALYRLLTLLGLQLPGPGMEDFLPMGANLQIVFFRNPAQQPTAGNTLVCFLLNERPCKSLLLSAAAEETFYRWTDVKEAVHDRIHYLEHLRQLSSLNTMVGTAPANTQSAGLFGKGSEEHGQTLPAVLVPNGQTFWTPQTQHTEQKCVAPYYYTDSLFQGIRASHWLVGGCTQDYGSFTISALGGATSPFSLPGTRFSHSDEVSHPYYYSVCLPDEQLKVELTALSHAAIMRVTPFSNQLVQIVVEANSDEKQSTIVVDTLRRLVTAVNPVHRIYQGWGKEAGFNGVFVMEYPDGIVDFNVKEGAVVLTFNGRQDQPLVLRMATSFTSAEGALANLQAEASDFNSMQQSCINAWCTRLHTIDVEDADTARVNQFYGALYRASFLPREMSDVNGTYPMFANGKPVVRHPSPDSHHLTPKHYGDFSMWDTYRALHPLLCIIAPEETEQMMQSLVDMYEEGGWLPIFPCWNSYTAAMIGDHCAATLADAYVKGIRDFDARKAYEAMRRNAFEQPDDQAYKDGMGRRALDSYIKYGYVPLEDSVKEAFHTREQTSRTLEYAFDDFAVAQMARLLGHDDDYKQLMNRSTNWRHVLNPATGYADGRHADGRWEGCNDQTHRQPFITEGATCHYTWYVPHDVDGLAAFMGGRDRFIQKLDTLFDYGRYWHGNEPCHQVPWLYAAVGDRQSTARRVSHILQTEYNDTAGGLSGNDDAGQMSAWQLFGFMGFYPVCPATPRYVLGSPQFRRITINQPGREPFVIEREQTIMPLLNGQPLQRTYITHDELLRGGRLQF